MSINYHHKDRVFKFIFGNPESKQWTLSLYNAINGSNYDNPDDIQFNTIEDAVYLGMKNDASFILAILNELIIWGHQSSFNPNVPLRIFIYVAKLYEAYMSSMAISISSTAVNFFLYRVLNVFAFIMAGAIDLSVKNFD